MGDKISGLGGLMAAFGALSAVLYLLNYNLRILMWIDNWGVGMGWVIRIGLIVVGAGLFFLFGKGGDDEKKKKKKEE